MAEYQECPTCGRSLPKTDFKRNGVALGWVTQCRFCTKDRDCLRVWGMTYSDMVLKFGDVCGLCKQPETASFRGRTAQLCIDHDHETMEVRGLLCRGCNVLVGYYEKIMSDEVLLDRLQDWVGFEEVVWYR